MTTKYHAPKNRDVDAICALVRKILTHGNLGFEPARDMVVVRRLPDDGETKGGIAIPDNHNAKAMPARGLVVAVGPGKTTKGGAIAPVPLAPGDIVLYWKFMTTSLGGYDPNGYDGEGELFAVPYFDIADGKGTNRGGIIAVITDGAAA